MQLDYANNSIKTFLIFSLFIIQGCVGTGYSRDFVPCTNDGWQEVDYPEFRNDNFVQYNCQDFTISLSDIWVSSQLLTIGCILPVIPFPIPMGSNDELPIKVILEGNFILPDKDTINLVINGDDIVKSNEFINYGKLFEYVFPILGRNVKSFSIVFQEPYTQCDIPPLSYSKKTNFGGGIANMGP